MPKCPRATWTLFENFYVSLQKCIIAKPENLVEQDDFGIYDSVFERLLRVTATGALAASCFSSSLAG